MAIPCKLMRFMSLNIYLTKYSTMSKSRILLIYALMISAYLIDKYVLIPNPHVQQAWLPLVLAAVGVGAQVAKGIKANQTAKRIRKDANNLYNQGMRREEQAKLEKTPFAVSNEFKDAMQKQLSDVGSAANTNSIEANFNKISDANASAATSAMKRGATSSAQYGTNVLALQKQQNADNLTASISGQQYQNQNRQMLTGLLGLQGQMDMYAWEKNTEAPWVLEMQRAMMEQNAGREGKVASRYLQQDAFNSYMNGLSSAASAGFSALGGFGGMAGGAAGDAASTATQATSSVTQNPMGTADWMKPSFLKPKVNPFG